MLKTIPVILLATAILSTISLMQATAAVTQYRTFGNDQIGTKTTILTLGKDATRFQLTETGTIQSITVYFANSGFAAKASVYKDANGIPYSLISQSSSKNIGQSGWTTFILPSKTLPPGYYWLSVVANNPAATIAYSETGEANQHCARSPIVFAREFSNQFEAPTKRDCCVTSIYAKYAVAPQTQPTDPTPTQNPTDPSPGTGPGTGPTNDVPGTFGNTVVGSRTLRVSKNKEATRFQLTQPGTLQSINVYFVNSGFSAKTAIYSDANGAPNKLIAQSSSQNVGKSGWNRFPVTQISLPAGYYWLSVVTSSSSAMLRSAAGAARQHCIRTTTYAAEFTSVFGLPKYDSSATSIYAECASNQVQVQKTVAIGIYSDQNLAHTASSIVWGNLEAGTTKSMVLYIRNEGNTPITLAKTLTNCNPLSALNYLTLTWDYSNQQISPDAVVRVTLSLSFSPTTPETINFSFDTIITAVAV
ncbi:MAG: hypothetical protein ACE14S_02050 [Candidatus Bathyarchaeia archaeon]